MRCEKLSRSLAIIQLTNMTAKGRGLGSMNPPQTWFLIQVGVFQVPGPHEGLSGLTLSPPACPSLFLTTFGGEIHSMVSASKRNEARCSVHDRYAHIVVFFQSVYTDKCRYVIIRFQDQHFNKSFQRGEELVLLFVSSLICIKLGFCVHLDLIQHQIDFSLCFRYKTQHTKQYTTPKMLANLSYVANRISTPTSWAPKFDSWTDQTCSKSAKPVKWRNLNWQESIQFFLNISTLADVRFGESPYWILT